MPLGVHPEGVIGDSVLLARPARPQSRPETAPTGPLDSADLVAKLEPSTIDALTWRCCSGLAASQLLGSRAVTGSASGPIRLPSAMRPISSAAGRTLRGPYAVRGQQALSDIAVNTAPGHSILL